MSPREELRHLLDRLEPSSRSAATDLLRRLAGGDTDRGDLLGVLENLDERQVARLLDMARALARPVRETLHPDSAVVTRDFASEFRSRILAHHATQTTLLDRLGFEDAFLAASRAAGRVTERAPGATTRFWDARVDGVQTALKSEGARNMRRDQLHISKLSEAAWIQDVRGARQRHGRTIELFADFTRAVGAFFVLRRWSEDPSYDLVEIPVAHFRLILDLPVGAFDSDGPVVPVTDAAGPILELKLDRSDSKVTIAKVRVNRCIVHGTWRLL